MTISSTTRKAGPFSGNNVTVDFPFTFKVFDETDIVVVATDASDVETTQTLTTHYTVSLNADQDASPGGTVTMLSVPASGTLLTITSDVPPLQAVALTNNGGFYPAVINGALDRLTILIQQVSEETDRAVKVAISSSVDPDALVASVTASEAAAAASAATAVSAAAAAEAAVPSGALGFTPVNITGDTMTGNLLVPGINVGGSGLITSLGNAATKTTGAASGNVPLVGAKSATKVLPGLNYDIPQIQPVGASVAANALTLTLDPTTLDFRSTTLTSGAVNTRQVAAQISLVISSGSTLGTVNATAARLAILAIDNAGTVELAVSNLSGGVNLDETTLISTTSEGGAGAADSATVIYSTTARTNVPFRVVGFVDITEATAGTWATAPTLVQGAGGNSMASLGTGQTWQTVTRVSGTTYYNTTGKPIFLNIQYTSGVGTIAITVDGIVVSQSGGTSGLFSVGAIIPPGRAYSFAGPPTINSVTELR